MSSERSYPLSIQTWAAYNDSITIKLADDTVVGYLPVPFVRTGGNDSWTFVVFVLAQLVQFDVDRSRHQLRTTDGVIVDEDTVPQAGVYTLLPHGM